MYYLDLYVFELMILLRQIRNSQELTLTVDTGGVQSEPKGALTAVGSVRVDALSVSAGIWVGGALINV